MNYEDILNIINKIEKGDNKTLTFLYTNDLISLQILYNKCAIWLFESEKHNYPKFNLSDDEKRIYRYSSSFFESYLNKEYNITSNDLIVNA